MRAGEHSSIMDAKHKTTNVGPGSIIEPKSEEHRPASPLSPQTKEISIDPNVALGK